MMTHTAFSHTHCTTGHHHAHSNESPPNSRDSGVYVHMELSFDNSLPSTETNVREGNNDSPKINPQLEVQNNNGERAEKDQDVNPIIMSDPDLVICTAGGWTGSTSGEDNREELMPPSMLAIPPPLPPKRHQRSPAFEKTLSQDTQLKTFNKENKALNSLACQTSPVLSGIKGINQCLDLVPGEVPGMHDSYGVLPKVGPTCPPQPPPRPPPKPPIKPPRSNNPKRAETDDGKQRMKQEEKWRKHKGKTGEKKNEEEQDLTERNEEMEENEETSGKGSRLDVGEPRQILVLFTDKEKGGEEGEGRGKEDEDPSNIGLTTPTMTENPSLLVMKCSDPAPDEEPYMAATNRNGTSTVPANSELTNPPQPPRKYTPKPPINLPQLFSALRAGIEEEREKRKQEDEQWRDKDLVDKDRNQSDGAGQDRGKVNGDLGDTELTESPSQLEETVMKSTVALQRAGKRFFLKSPRRNRPTPGITAENQTPAWVNPIGTDSNIETLEWTENNKKIQMSGQGGQDSEVISRSHREGTEVVVTKWDPCQLGLQRLEDARGTAETLLDGEPKQTNQKTNARGKVKWLAKKVVSRLKEGREEKRRIKVEEMERDGGTEDDSESTQQKLVLIIKDERRHWGEGGMEEEEEEWIEEDAVDQSAVAETQSHADLVERRIKRRNATSESPFSSFKVCSPVKLVEELLSGEEWSQFLNRDQRSTPDPPPNQTHSVDAAQLSAELDLALDVFEGHPAVPEAIYEDIDLSNIITEEQQEMNRAAITAIQKISLESETSQMSPRTKDIYDTVVFIQPVQPANTCVHFPDVKSRGVLDSSVQKYLIKVSKKRRHRAARKRRRAGSHETLGQSPPTTSPQQVFPASIFYNVPASGGEEEQQLSTVKSGGSSPRSLAKIKRATQQKEGRGK